MNKTLNVHRKMLFTQLSKQPIEQSDLSLICLSLFYKNCDDQAKIVYRNEL